MVRVFFSAVVAAASSSQYDGGFNRQWAGEVDGVHREKPRLTAAQSNGRKGKDGNFWQGTRIGNDPELAPRDGRLVSPMNGERRMTISIGSFLETWRGKVMLVCVTTRSDHWLTDVIQVRRPAGGLWIRRKRDPRIKWSSLILHLFY